MGECIDRQRVDRQTERATQVAGQTDAWMWVDWIVGMDEIQTLEDM